MKYCREMFLKAPPPDSVTESQLLDTNSKAIDDDGTQKKGKKSRRRKKLHKNALLDDSLNWVTDNEESYDGCLSPRRLRRRLRAEEDRIQFTIMRRIFEAQSQEVKDETNKNASLDDSANWVTENEESSDEGLSIRRRKKKLRAEEDRIQFAVMRSIFDAQSQDVKDVISDLYNLHLKQQRAAMCKRKFARPILSNIRLKKHRLRNNVRKLAPGGALRTTNVGFSSNIKILARLQRRRRHRGKPRSKKHCRKKFPRRRRRANAKKGNRQGRKRCLRAQRLFDKGIFLVGRKLLDDVWQAVKDPNSTATSFCNNNTHGLSKIHKKQIELYERIEDDLHRLDAARQEREEAALERKAKEQERGEKKNKIEVRAAVRAEQDSLRKQRRAARKQRALEKKSQREKTKFEDFVKPVVLE